MLYETDGSGVLQVRYIYGSDYKPEAMIRGGNTYYYHYNGHGDVVALTDQNGAVVAEYDYDAYGLPVATGLEGSVVNPYRYAGYRYDSETGFYYLNARYYWAEVGRFITRDTFHGFQADPSSLNQYAYAQGNPVMYSDPSGFWVGPIGAVIGAGFGALFGLAVAKHYGLKGWIRKATIIGFALGTGVIGWFAGPVILRIAKSLLPQVARKHLFPKGAKDIKKVFGVADKTFHSQVKPLILKQLRSDSIYGELMQQMGKNPDIGVNAGKIVIRNVQNGKELVTDWLFKYFLP